MSGAAHQSAAPAARKTAMPQKEAGAPPQPPRPTQHDNGDHIATVRHAREIDWYSVAAFAAPLLARFTSLPLPGTPTWCSLPDTDPRKVAALVSVARYWAFDAACRQDAMIQASEAISAAADWAAVARQIRARRSAYIPRVVS